MKRPARLLWLGLLALLPACASVGPREPVRFGAASRPAGAESFPNSTAPPAEAMRAMVVRSADGRRFRAVLMTAPSHPASSAG